MSSIDQRAIDDVLGALFGETDEGTGYTAGGALSLARANLPAAKAAVRQSLARALPPGGPGGRRSKIKVIPCVPGAALGVMAPGATVLFTAQPQRACRVIQMVIGAAPTAATQAASPEDPLYAIQVNSIMVGDSNMLFGAGVAPGAAFGAIVQQGMEFDASPVSQTIVASLTNIHATKSFTSVAVCFIAEAVE